MAWLREHKLGKADIPKHRIGPAAKPMNDEYVERSRFYDTRAWRRLRKWTLAREPLCRMCKSDGKLVTATQVDHIIPIAEDASRSLDSTNLQSLCQSCHSRKTGEDRRRMYGYNPHDQGRSDTLTDA